jgi:hypothetical protein
MSAYRHVTATTCCATVVSDHKSKHSLSLTNNKLSLPNNMQNCKCSTLSGQNVNEIQLLHSRIRLINHSVTYRYDEQTDKHS